jgi:hypothetical protein
LSVLEQVLTSEEFAEYQAYFELEGTVRQQIADGVDPQVAYEMVWTARDED